jgi:hypothetical protein
MSFCTVPAELVARHALLLGDQDVERQEHHGGRVDGHRGGDLGERNIVKQPSHVVQRCDGHADLADLAARQRVVGVEAELRGQVEGDGESGGALGQEVAVASVRLHRAAEPGVLAHRP